MIKKSKKFLNSIWFRLKKALKKELYQLFSNFYIRLIFIPPSNRIIYCSIKTIKDLDDFKLKEYNLAKDKGHLANKIIKNLNINNLNIIHKLSWLIAYSKYEHFTITKFIKILESKNFSAQFLREITIFIPTPFAHYGDYERYEKLLLWGKNTLDKKLKRKKGLYNESSYFTAIGHMWLLVYLLKAIETKIIDLNQVSIELAVNKKSIRNYEYFKLLFEKCKATKIKLNYYQSSYLELEPDMELWPTSFSKSYLFSRHIVGITNKYWESQNKSPLIFPNKMQLEIGEKILKRNYNNLPKNFVGIHLRIRKDNFSLRNTSKEIAEFAIKKVLSLGFECILIGTKISLNDYLRNSIYDFKDQDNLYDTTKLSLSKYERECLQLYIWSKSKFFIGSQSGGTMPPIGFGVPTIWLDVHPIVHYRSPSNNDHIIPKRIFYKKENKFLSLKEIFNEKHSCAQAEEHQYILKNGYEVFSCKEEQVSKSIKDMRDRITSNKKLYDHNLDNIGLSKKLKNLANEKFSYGGEYYF